MNFLAHLLLSFPNDHLMVGNFIADFINKKEELDFTNNVQIGIQMHRFIDYTCDKHDYHKAGTQLLKPYLHKYAPVGMDILADYILENHWATFSNHSYSAFSEHSYKALTSQIHQFPIKAREIAKAMIQASWLEEYRSLEGLHQVFLRVNRRASFPVDFTQTVTAYIEHRDFFNNAFVDFFHDLQSSCTGWKQEHMFDT